MKHMTIHGIPGYQEWLEAAQGFFTDGIPPEHILWETGQSSQGDLFTATLPADHPPNNTQETVSCDWVPIKQPHSSMHFSKTFLKLCEKALCHRSPERFSLCYRVLWRAAHENQHLLHLRTDPDMFRLDALIQAVRRDAYKMTAFLRFREIQHNGTEQFIAWYEPDHYTLELNLEFFKTRFKNMRWSILTPYRAAYWDKKSLTLEDNPDPSVCPGEDNMEKFWLTYYANIFNPARPKRDAMLAQMPKKYWKNMPEANLIDDLLRTSEVRTRKMLEKP
jgi:uracil-DNA glycosylase